MKGAKPHTQICGGCGGRLVCTVCALPGELDLAVQDLQREAVLVMARIMRGGGEMRNAQQQIAAARAFLELGETTLRSLPDEALLAEMKRRTEKKA